MVKNTDDVNILEVSTPYQGFFRVDRYRFRKRRHDGSWSDELTHDIFERGRTVGVLPYDPALDSVVLIEQVRIGVHAGGGPLRPVEIVAGISEPGEAADDVARRELTEETGLTAIDLCPIGGVFLSPGGSSEHMTLFLARVDARGAGGHHGNRHEGARHPGEPARLRRRHDGDQRRPHQYRACRHCASMARAQPR